MSYFDKDNLTAYEAKVRAQLIAFAPIVFQSSRLLRDFGILSVVESHRKEGIPLEEIQKKVSIPEYGTKVLLEAGLGIGLVYKKDDLFYLSKLGHFILHDRMSRVNMDFTHDICYEGMFSLDEAIRDEKPAGLKVLGDWNTIYESLAHLPTKLQESWFAFDHYYSDYAFPMALPYVLKENPKKLLDVGGNTGRWALMVASQSPQVHVTIVDLPGQIEMAMKEAAKKELGDRIDGYPMNILDLDAPFPKGYQAIWMSQFLDCFSTAQIISILKRAADVMDEDASLFILETYWDRQQNETAAFCLQQTSLYFTCMANGNSQMYHSADMKKCVDESGLDIVEDIDNIGLYHTLFRCKLKKGSKKPSNYIR